MVTLFAAIGTWTFASTSVHAAPSLLDQCVSSINDPAFTKAFILTQTGFADEAALLAAVASNSWTLQISTGPGWSPTMRGNNPDIYCGDANDNYIQFLDSNPSGSHDFFSEARATTPLTQCGIRSSGVEKATTPSTTTVNAPSFTGGRVLTLVLIANPLVPILQHATSMAAQR
jgi:hypothetical protein